MSKTDNTLPYRLRAKAGLPSYRKFWAGTRDRRIGYCARARNRQARHRAKNKLKIFIEPEPYRARHSAEWDAH